MTLLEAAYNKKIVMTFLANDCAVFILEDDTRIIITIEHIVNPAGWRVPKLFVVDENGTPLLRGGT